MPISELLLIPNLLSLSRVALTPLIGYFLWRNDSVSTAICLALLVVAGITDALDGYYARKLNLRSDLGLILDPLADKIFAAVLLIELIIFRDFPVWLAVAVIGRDLLFAIAGAALIGKRKVPLASNLTGKYAFFSVVVLIGFSVLSFESGVKIVAVFTLLLLVMSAIFYFRAMLRVLHGVEPGRFVDKPFYRWTRVGGASIVLICCAVIFIMERLCGLRPLPW
ncbi:MAG: CDP-alcohol phosphatidyltransferase family protein [candidate division Zixibacteria bacterium]|nr:CDP-alcohol phosphatidyltransferase family protein [candidate division Zixibacteria bacterium]